MGQNAPSGSVPRLDAPRKGRIRTGNRGRPADSRSRVTEKLSSERLRAEAQRVGFQARPCSSCGGHAPGCANCDGLGYVWRHSAGATLSEAGLQRLLAKTIR
jgi:hypothetical protein